jgi:hypothetical protein
MVALWLIVPAVLFLASKSKQAAPAPAEPSAPEHTAIAQDVQFVAKSMHDGTNRGTQLAAGARDLLSLGMLHSTFVPPPTKTELDPPGHGGWRGK